MSKTLGKKLEAIRVEKGMSQEEFADAIGVSRQTVYRWESGVSEPKAENISAICKLLGPENEAYCLNVSGSDTSSLKSTESEISAAVCDDATAESTICDKPSAAVGSCAADNCRVVRILYSRTRRRRIVAIAVFAALFAISLFVTIIMGCTLYVPGTGKGLLTPTYNYYTPLPVFILMLVVTVALAAFEILSVFGYIRFRKKAYPHEM